MTCIHSRPHHLSRQTCAQSLPRVGASSHHQVIVQNTVLPQVSSSSPPKMELGHDYRGARKKYAPSLDARSFSTSQGHSVRKDQLESSPPQRCRSFGSSLALTYLKLFN
uniref:Uncharacterized protein n=1 Tax=Schistocephalus solidus TaxID=70667 RepID=A0A0X3Q330_SCHSO